SMGTIGDAYDKAMAESFFSTLQRTRRELAVFEMDRSLVPPAAPSLEHRAYQSRPLRSRPRLAPREHDHRAKPRAQMPSEAPEARGSYGRTRRSQPLRTSADLTTPKLGAHQASVSGARDVWDSAGGHERRKTELGKECETRVLSRAPPSDYCDD